MLCPRAARGGVLHLPGVSQGFSSVTCLGYRVLFTEGSGAEIKDSRENKCFGFHFLQADDRVAVDPVCECVGAMFANVSMCVCGGVLMCGGLRSRSGVSH